MSVNTALLVELGASPDFPDAQCCNPAHGTTAELVTLFGSVRKRDVARAKAICGTCPHELDCLAFSLVTWEPFGTWGGVSEKQRRRLFTENRRQRRRLEPASAA